MVYKGKIHKGKKERRWRDMQCFYCDWSDWFETALFTISVRAGCFCIIFFISSPMFVVVSFVHKHWCLNRRLLFAAIDVGFGLLCQVFFLDRSYYIIGTVITRRTGTKYIFVPSDSDPFYILYKIVFAFNLIWTGLIRHGLFSMKHFLGFFFSLVDLVLPNCVLFVCASVFLSVHDVDSLRSVECNYVITLTFFLILI